MAKTTKKPVKKPILKGKESKDGKDAKSKAQKPSKPVKKAEPSSAAKSAKLAKPEVKSKGVEGKKVAPAKVEVKPTSKDEKKSAKKDSKKSKKAKENFDSDSDDLLTSDEEIGSEDIPDLSEFEETEVEEVVIIAESDSDETDEVSSEVKSRDDEVVLTDAEGRVYCRVRDCDQISAVEGYCRYHYLLLWKKIQVRRKILVDGKLERYVEELTSRYPDKFLEMIRKDLRSEKDFLSAIAELEIDESANESEFEDEAQSYVDEMRGITTESGMSDEEEF